MLVLARTDLLNAYFPVFPLALLFASRYSPARLVSPPTTSLSYNTRALSSLTWAFPPSPMLMACLLPWVRVAYLQLRKAAMRVLDLPVDNAGILLEPMFERDALRAAERREARAAAEEHEEPELQPVEIKGESADQLQVQSHISDETSTLAVARLSSIVVEALLFPLASSLVGRLLYRLATKSSTNHFLQSFGPKGSASPLWRNLVGGGLVVLARDVGFLLMGLLSKRTRSSRRISSSLRRYPGR